MEIRVHKNAKLIHYEDAIVWEQITLRGKTAKSFPPPSAYQFATLQSGRQ
jgi:hypothetical protein